MQTDNYCFVNFASFLRARRRTRGKNKYDRGDLDGADVVQDNSMSRKYTVKINGTRPENCSGRVPIILRVSEIVRVT